MVINTNLSAQTASGQLAQTSAQLARALARLSSGSKITSAADDSAGQAVSLRLRAQTARVTASMNNLANAISFTQTQDGYLQKVSEALTRMGEIGVLAADPTKTDADRALYSREFDTLAADIGSASTKTFNGVNLFSANPLDVTMDAEANTFTMTGVNLNSTSYTSIFTDHVNIIGNPSTGAIYAVRDLTKVMTQLAKDRALLGSNLARLMFHHDELAGLKNNLSAANSRITDVDVAQESTNYAKYNILVQSGTAMLSQANSLPQSVLKLLG